MKKRILSILLCCVMLAGMLPTAALAEGSTLTQTHTHCVCCGDTDVGDHTTHTDVTYQPWDGTSDIDYGDDNTAYVCLTDNVTIQESLEIEAGKTLYLCLNGKTFASNGTKKIEMRENSRFILCDCVGGGTIDGADNCWGGAGIYLHNSTMDMYGGKITGGHTGNGGGGAIALDDVNCIFNMYGGEISGNKADRYGGAIFLNGTLQTKKGGTVNIYGGTISNNSAQIGGAIYAVYGGTVNLFGGEISGNTATANGGGAICLNHSGVLNMTGGKMQNNTAKTDGGAVNLYASTFTFSGGTISSNHANEYGGAVYLSISGKLNMTGGEICNNTAAEEGGAVHVYGQNATFNLSSGTITGNEAVDGGAVYLNQENSTLNMTGGEISGNKAARYGGAVYMFRATSTLNLSGGTIKNNTAGSSGGAVYFNTTSDGKIQGILNISGNPVVKDNTVSDKANNVALKTGKTLSIVEAMTDGASVGITTESTEYPVVFSNAYDTNYKGYFFADDENAHVNYNSDKKLELAAGAPHTHSWATAWSKNDTHHWHECTATGCDVTNDADKNGYAEHTYDQEIATADYKASDATCTAKATYYKSCICGAKGTATFESGEIDADNHTGSLGDWQTSADKHWKEYSCCHVKAEEATHDYTDDADTDCNTCRYTRTITPVHTHSWSEDWSKNDTHHWHECTTEGCDVTDNAGKQGYGAHSGTDDGDCTTAVICECGYTITAAKSHDFSGAWQSDGTGHWHVCQNDGCTVAENKTPHSGTDDGDCTTAVICECGYTITAANDEHTYEWQSENGQYWKKCKFCDYETAKKDIPTITINGADTVCRTQDYKFSFTLPEGATDAVYGYEFETKGDLGFPAIIENNEPHGVVSAKWYEPNENSFKVYAGAKTADGFEFFASKTVALKSEHTDAAPQDHICDICGETLSEHTGGEATCKDKAVCEYCGNEYGALAPNNHTDLKHFPAKAATKTAEGNIEYWYCSGCGKYYKDVAATIEIAKADTVIAKLPDDSNSLQTGDNSHMALWIVLLLVSGGAVIGTTVVSKKRKHSEN